MGAARLLVKLRLGDAMLDSAHTLDAADRRTAWGAAVDHIDQAGAYLTDGVFLYSVVGVLVTGFGEMVDLEDCYGLDVVRVPVGDLLARRLRVVIPG